MGRVYDDVSGGVADFVARQHVFFVSTAPLSGSGLVNLSPKGIEGTFTILDPHTVAYADLVGSGVETIAHLRENGRITLMFCAFDGPPRIVRLYGTGEVIEPGDGRFADLAARFPDYRNLRSIVVVAVHRVADSCGYGVPVYEYRSERDHLERWADRRSDEELAAYQMEKNSKSLDGLPGLYGSSLK